MSEIDEIFNPKSREHRIKDVEHLLGEPFALEFTDYATKIRTHLFFISALSVIMVFANVTLNTDDSTLLGLKFHNISNDLIFTILLILNGYFLFHFLWIANDYFQQWRIRLSGISQTKKKHSEFKAVDLDTPKDPRQSTLYSWWLDHRDRVEMLNTDQEIQKQLSAKLTKLIEDKYSEKSHDTFGHSANDLANALRGVQSSLDKTQAFFEEPRLEVSLKRFDNYWSRLQTSQNIRWLLLELALPVSLGIWAIYLLISKIWFP